MNGAPSGQLAAGGLVLAAYLVGSIPTGYLIGRLRGVDVRTQGSGNIGATNVARTVGRKLGILVLVLDALKGAVPLLVWRLADLPARVPLSGRLAPFLFTAFGIAPIIGHCFTVWLRFRGGKGVATALGVFLVADPILIAIGGGLFAVLYAATRIVSIGSLTAALAIPTAAALLGRPAPLLVLAVGGSAIVIAKHHGNIRRLLRRRELKV
ncbi:MAG TPA: glycerol-3-phosphate 1-O-acyltransferase PlsY [Kofleriaceae bacterium]|nr:glycerol-3-phosphate 1-O-acyltransferase PlsY [Kofleriaceae bacterium]